MVSFGMASSFIITGIRPASPGFATVTIRPQHGPLKWAKGTMVRPKGFIAVDVKVVNGNLTGTVKVPAGVEGAVVANGSRLQIKDTVVTF